MYKIVIVEDEERIRAGLKNLIDWSDMGFEAVADFADGDEALKFMMKNPIHVLLTDIKMEGMSGIDLAKCIRENHRDIKIIFLSGYRDFDYAKSAISLSVENYLIKPVKLEELYSVFRKIKKDLDDIRTTKNEIKGFNYNREIITYMIEQLLYDLLIGAIRTPDQLRERSVRIGRNILKGYFQVVLIEIKDATGWMYGKENLFTAVCNILNDIKETSIELYPILLQNEYIAVYVVSDTIEMLQIRSENIPKEMKEGLNTLIKIDISIAKSSAFQDHLQAPAAYLEAKRRLMGFFNEDREMADRYREISSTSDLSEIYGSLLGYIIQGDVQAVQNLLDIVLNQVFCEGESELSIRNFLNGMISYLVSKVKGMLSGTEKWNDFDYSALYLSDHIIQIRLPIMKYFTDITGYFVNNRIKSDHEIVLKAKEYIEAHYADEISLGSVAETVFLSPAYFSKIFKEACGENFIDYLTAVRINKAKDLLKNRSNKVYEVALKVGYTSDKYFSRIFKSYTSYTPSDYQKKG